jgi:hypothetical protein
MDYKKYIFSFLITATIFATAIYISNYFGQRKLNEIRNIQDKIAIDILSSETQFSLLGETSCKDVGTKSLSDELGELEKRLTYTENQRGEDDSEVIILKKYYSLLEIKDFILMRKISEKCKKSPISIIYFYATGEKCEECLKQGYVLTSLREKYPDLRIYSFDYNIDLSAVKTLISINKIKGDLPALIIEDKVYYGFSETEKIEKLIPELKNIATSTKRI